MTPDFSVPTLPPLAHSRWRSKVAEIEATLRRFFLEPVSTAPLAALRLGVSAGLLWQVFQLAGNVLEFYGRAGMLQGGLHDYLTLPISHALPGMAWLEHLFLALGLGNAGGTHVVFLLYAVSLFFLFLGYYTRMATVICCLSHFLLIGAGYLASYGVDWFAQAALFYFLFLPKGLPLSLDRYLRGMRTDVSSGAALLLRLFQVHLCLVYFSSGVFKSLGVQWRNGEIIWRALLLTQDVPYGLLWLAKLPWLAKLMAWGTLVLEIGYPFFIWPRRTRRAWVAAIVSLHLGIALTLRLVSFSAMMVALTFGAFGVRSDVSARN